MSASTLHRPVPVGSQVPAPRQGGSAPVEPAAAAPGAGRRGLTVGRRLGLLAGLGGLAVVAVSGVSSLSLSSVRSDSDTLVRYETAQTALLRLDTRSSELKVDAYKAALRATPTEERADVADDIATAQGLLQDVAALHLTGELGEKVATLRTTFQTYVGDVQAYVETSVKDQAAARARYDDVQKANNGVDDALGAAVDSAQAAVLQARKGVSGTVDGSKRLGLVVTLLALAGLAGAAVLVSRAITGPLHRVRASLEALAAGDLTVEAGVRSGDELGQMAGALEKAQESLRGMLRAMAGNASTLAAASEELSATAGAIAGSADETSAQAGIVSAAAEQVSRNVQTVATGAEEMGFSIREISQNANEAARVGGSAVGIAEATTATVTRLGDSSKQIGDVVKAITSIAEQTNLLALNATIEAARAGEAGKGFAVVANEVKDLAQETAKATEDIGQRVMAIQADTAGAVTAIGEISAVIARMNDFQTTIASAVEEQTATTNEMSRNVGEAALGSTQIAENIVGVAAAAQNTSRGVQDSQSAAAELGRMSSELQSLVATFRY